MIKIEIYKDKSGEYRSRIKSSNGRIRFDSGEGYKRKSAAVRSIEKLAWDIQTNMYTVVVV